jgi:hypothetical protein
MSLFGVIMRKGAQLGAKVDEFRLSDSILQERQLLSLLRKGQFTAFGREFQFTQLLLRQNVQDAFRTSVPAFDYNQLYKDWWSQARLCDTPSVCWPGKIPYYALSSGTSQAASKYIPVTDDILRGMKRASRRMFCDMATFNLPPDVFSRHMLMVGSSTAIRQEGRHFVGDLSGILGQNRPLWLERYYRPGRHITNLPDWNDRMNHIAEEAPRWDIGFIVGNPMWVQLIFERMLERHRVPTVHHIWPNLTMLVHGGVFFEPYRPSLERCLDRPLVYVDSYMASEGFFGYQDRQDTRDLRLLPDCGVFYEFIPFDEDNFDDEGNMRSAFPKALLLDEVEEGVQYALLISTSAGAWRYLLGDTVQFTNLSRFEYRLTGRTKQFLSVCGEHLSIDNLNHAVEAADAEVDARIREFAVAGLREGSMWAHHWYVSSDNPDLKPEALRDCLDKALAKLNDDYAIERQFALHNIYIDILPQSAFMGWMAQRGKLNGQAKVPRVLKGTQLHDFQQFVQQLNPRRA